MNEPRDIPPDAWLTEALRHAPDADARPPQALSDTILRQARAATAAHAPARWPMGSAMARAWAWLARPAVAGGFASVMVATLVGVMWWGQPLDDGLRRPSASVPSQVPSRAPSEVPSEVTAQVRAPVPTPAPAAMAAASEVRPAQARATTPLAVDATTASAPAGTVAPRADNAEFERAGSLSKAATRATTAAPTAPAIAGATAAEAEVARRREAAVPAADAVSGGPPEALQARAPSAPAVKLADASAPAAPAPRSQGEPPRADALLSTLLADVAREPQRWRAQRGASEAQAMTPALQRWLAQLARASAGAWQPATALASTETGAAGAAGAASADTTLRLLRDGELRATLRLSASGVWAASASRRPDMLQAAQAVLAEPVIAALKRALTQALNDAPP